MGKLQRMAAEKFLLLGLLGLLAFLGGCQRDASDARQEITPSVYLLNHKHWTSVLVLNFAQEVAPWDAIGKEATPPPRIDPPSPGKWVWQDPSRLAFFPEYSTFQPDSRLTVSLTGLPLRDGYEATARPVPYQTPPLMTLRHECRWQDILQAPMRRYLQADVDFNYPLIALPFSATLDGKNALPLQSGSGTHITVNSNPLLRPSENGALAFSLEPGAVSLLARDDKRGFVAGGQAKLTKGAACQLNVARSDWDKIDEEPAKPPMATSIDASLVDGTILVSLQGQNITESAKKGMAGQETKQGVSISPAMDGTWKYGDSASGPDLIFTPANPVDLKPGIQIDVSVTREAFPQLPFWHDRLSGSVTVPNMQGTVERMQLYTDPVEPRTKRITTSINYNYPLQPGSLEAKTSLRLREEPAKTFSDSRVRSIPFELSYDEKNPKRAYLKSAPLQLPQEPGEARLEVDGGLISAIGGEKSPFSTGADLVIPSAKDYFRITGVETSNLDKGDGDIERLLMVHTTTPLKEPSTLPHSVDTYVLPDCRHENLERPALCEKKEIDEWATPDQVDDDTIKLSTRVPVKWRDQTSEDKTVHFLSYSAPEKRQIFVKVKQGLESVDGFQLHKDARFLFTLGANQRELKIQHDGALLSLSGSKKLGVAARGVRKVHVELQRILPHNMHHLAQFTRGKFQNPTFTLPIEHFAEKYGYDETLPLDQDMQRRYFAVDFARFAKDKGYPPRGLFLLSVTQAKQTPPCAVRKAGCPQPAPVHADEQGEESPDEAESAGEENERENSAESEDEQVDAASLQDRRLVLLTDLGLLVKTRADGGQDVFVISFLSGQPVAGAQVSLLGMNGIPVAAGTSDNQGHVSMPSVQGLDEEKTPSVYLAEKDGDLSFLPFSRSDRQLNLSRFDVGGLRDAPDTLHAYVFSDRGIYRPGDAVHFGLILRRRDWAPLPAGLPLKAVLTDPENQEVLSQTLAFGAEGFESLDWTSSAGGKTGTYRLELFIADGNKTSLGSTTVRVEEFQPDRLQVKTEIVGAPPQGWLTPDAPKAKITVRNLFGTPAAGGLAKLELTAKPWSGQVPGFTEYRFRSGSGGIPHLPQDLGEASTDEQGEALFDLPLANIDEPVFEISLAGEGFEKGSGRSVVGMASTLVSKHPYLLGHSADGDLGYIAKGARRQIKLLAVGTDFQPKDIGEVTVEHHETRYVSTLVKRPDGLYAYQSVQRDEPRRVEKLTLAGGKAALSLPTEEPGSFYAAFKNAQGEELNRVYYSVAGTGNVTRNIERNAELQLTLNKSEYRPGEEIEVQIIAPYQGAGLITVEQDGVIASKWIKTNTTASTARIALPQGIKGNAYVSVAFVRSLDSREIYMSPLSYGVAPFSISRQAFMNDVSLSVPETVQPGGTLEVRYKVKEATRLVLYVVDEGILQFAHYKNPQPLDYFFRKRALQTQTHQILDLILPDFALVQSLSAAGGDEDAGGASKYKNPFARKHKPPLAFWSGILDAKPGEHTLSIPVPDYFNGSIRVLAVAANAGKLAVPTAKVVARNPFVIQPQQPYAVAPGDEFEMGVLVANTTGEPGDKAVEVSVAAGDALEIQSPNPQTLTLAPGKDGTVRFKAKAKDKLGPVEVRYRAAGGGKDAGYSEEMSIRPSQPLLTTLQNGVLRIDAQQKGKSETVALKREVYAEQRHSEMAVSMTPTAYLRGIVDYLKHYPYGCTEQLVSQAFPAVLLGANAELGLSAKDVESYLGKTLHTLQTRQKHDGSFAYWTITGKANPFYSMYATHLLLEARELGHKVPDAMIQRALGYTDQYTQETHYQWDAHQAEAYALYLLARNGQNVAERIKAFEAELQRQWGQGGPAAIWTKFFLGAAYKLHHLDKDADRFFGEFQRQWKQTGQLPWGIQGDISALSQYLYLTNKHFPELIDTKDPQFGNYLYELAQDMVKQRINSFSGSMAALGLGGLWPRFDQDEGKAFSLLAGQPPAPLDLQGKTVKRAVLESAIRQLELQGNGTWNLYYQLTERGYDRSAPKAAINQGITLVRELLNEKGEKTADLDLQDKLHIRFSVHPDQPMKDLAVVMLIPGGFEIDLGEDGLANRQSLPIPGKTLWQPEYIDVQEDRVVFFGDLDGGDRHFEFRLKPLNVGTYAVPPVMAEGMYDTSILHRGMAETLKVHE